jgi:hypothetical protein
MSKKQNPVTCDDRACETVLLACASNNSQLTKSQSVAQHETALRHALCPATSFDYGTIPASKVTALRAAQAPGIRSFVKTQTAAVIEAGRDLSGGEFRR